MPDPNGSSFFRGERLTAAKLNELADKGRFSTAGPVRISDDAGGRVIKVDQVEVIYIRLTEKDTTKTPIRYGWKEVIRKPNSNKNPTSWAWFNTDRTAKAKTDYATELNNADVTVGGDAVYRAERSVTTGEWVFTGSGGGSLKATSNSIIMLLGTYDQYKDCPEISGAGSPPRNDQGEICGHYYAWAEYAVCGYKMKKIRDMRDFPYWASPLNNPEGGASGLRRLYNAFFGDPSGNCQGVRFDCGCSVGNLDCVCPTWMNPVKCLKLKFTIIDRPCPANGPDPWCGFGNCAEVMQNMDDFSMWGKTYEIELCGGSCNFSGNLGATGWGADLLFSPAYVNTADHCFWGPDWLDPCNPCEGFGEFSLSITSGDKRADCAAAGVITGWFTDIQMKDLVTNCNSKKPARIKLCRNCHDGAGGEFHPVIAESVEILCCDPKNQGACP